MILNTLISGEGPPLVLLHGLFGAAKNLGALSRGLSPQARVIAMDLRNHGDSPHGAAMDFATMAGDVADTCAALGVARARVAGHSLGGKTAMMLALLRPELVERLAVLDIAPMRYDHDYDDYVKAMQAIELHPGLSRGEADAALAHVVKAAPMRAFLLNNLSLGAVPHWRAGLDEIGAAMPDLLSWNEPQGALPYQGPALFLRGGESDYVPDAAGPGIKRLFPRAVVETVAGAGHWLHAEKPAQVLASLQGFFFP
ncbi:esterase [Acidocella aquatica]|uniref:Esterase n=2 Tax=Acidocella aquatica TaxID=1922313 RepID=A0ABQ6AAK7_9PROT|nr:esterase [Acidocella aquatica]